ncbi:unnamed protein product [Rhizophagus irregularis]|nr:unnamed protein product [Rhizophagus irregularis]CAB5376894.1 unnamed protein product [Rhizophagus irregularis]
MRAVYFLAKRDPPLRLLPSIMEIMKELGTPHISDGSITYTNEISGREFLVPISKIIEYEIWEELSDATAFGVMIDEKSITQVLKILSKLAAFASDGALVMLGKNEDVAAELSRILNFTKISKKNLWLF